MAVDLYQLGVSGLLSSQKQLSTTGHNIANVNTEGYSRQRVIQDAAPALWEGGSYFGTGTQVIDVQRSFNKFAYQELVFNQARLSGDETRGQKMSELDELLSRVGAGVGTSLNELFSAVNSVVDTPNDIGVRNVMLSNADTVAFNFNSIRATLENQLQGINEDIEVVADRISEIGAQIAVLNQDIISAEANGINNSPNDLLDKRDGLVKELAEYTTTSTVDNGDGSITVFIGNGQTLVTQVNSFEISVRTGNPDPQQTELVLTNNGSGTVPLDGARMGGQIGAMFTYRDNDLRNAINELGLTAMAVADSFNQQQAQGLDLDGNIGNDLYRDINDIEVARLRMKYDSSNAGNMVGNVTINDMNMVTGDDYEVAYDLGTNSYTITNTNTGSNQTVVRGAAPFSFSFEGIDFNEESGAPADGDTFLLQPTASGAADIRLEIDQPERIAASSIAEVTANEKNVGTGSVSITNTTGIDNFNVGGLAFPYEVRFVNAVPVPGGTQYDVEIYDNSGALFSALPGAYDTTAQPTTINVPLAPGQSFDIEIEGDPVGQPPNAPDTFAVEYVFGSGNNKNALAMADLQTAKVAKNGRSTMFDNFQSLVTEVGAATQTAEINYNTSLALYTQAEERMQSISGVNLDEEASNLLRFQQSYNAAARIITVAGELFDTLLASAR
ncbi:flagellar hook-associated protein FlgK [Corallincola spongiicola]|uniref:Flagellar hook-associated protein 1 n=1 Tax=Corallincola spongiicola TaxID=2520508 RepID=A0ABY1WKU0_9GAMM|nr:flagellar hook-associated protein FlgK [Corallincola spongiicola]TAA40333.1 flagellar hook-associated protein FlgK [Corallincola spongiicola]